MAPNSPGSSTITLTLIKGMIQGPLTGATDSDSASASDVTALTGVVATNTAAINTKADGSALTTAESTISTHTLRKLLVSTIRITI